MARRRVPVADAWANADQARRLLPRAEEDRRPRLLTQAIVLLEAAITGTHIDDPELAGYHSDLGYAYRLRYERIGREADLSEAVRLGQIAVSVTPPSSPHRSGTLANLALTLRLRARSSRNPGDLDEAVRIGEEAVRVSSPDDPSQSLLLSNLAGSLGMRFDQTGDERDLTESIRLLRQAVVDSDDPHLDGYRVNLAIALVSRHNRRSARADLDEAADLVSAVADRTGQDHPELPETLFILGNVLQRRHECTGSTKDVQRAEGLIRRAAALVPVGHPDHARYLQYLTHVLRRQFMATGDEKYLNDAVATGRTSRSDLNLAAALAQRFQVAGDSSDLDEAIRLGQRVIKATPIHHPKHAECALMLGSALFRRSGLSRSLVDLTEAFVFLTGGSGSVASPARYRLAAAQAAADIVTAGLERELAPLIDFRPDGLATAAYESALALQPLVMWRGLATDDRQRLLSTHAPTLARDGCAAATEAGLADRAIQLLEMGRNVLWGQLLEMRTDLDAVHRVAPELAERLARCRAGLDAASGSLSCLRW